MSYARPPITEAVIDIQVDYPSPPDIALYERFTKTVQASLPVSAPLHLFEMGIENNAAGSGALQVKSGGAPVTIGMRAASPASDRVAQIHQRGFTFSMQAPYAGWDAFSAEAQAVWTTFLELVGPQRVNRVGVRYINRIVIPQQRIEFEDYFRLYPAIPKDVPQDVTGCFMQLVMPQADLGPGANAIVNFAGEPNAVPGAISFLLDIDVYCNAMLEARTDLIWEHLDKLRVRKNQLFEASITDRTRELFQ
ncbi:hypothetical protein D9M68_356940 [compost metagenome]